MTAAACSSTATGNGGQGGHGDTAAGGAAGDTGDGGHQTGVGGEGAGGAGNNGQGGHSSDAGPDATSGAGDCQPACGTGSVCVGTGVQGGAVFFADGGACPTGRHVDHGLCLQDLTFACMPIPGGCNGTATCVCASSLCNGRICGAPSAGELTCILAVP